MSEHVLKTWPGPFAAVRDGLKTFEWRRDDRGYEVGDVLRLREWDPCCSVCGQECSSERMSHFALPSVATCNGGRGARGYTGEEIVARVMYVLRGPAFGVPDGFAVMSIALEAARD